MTANLRALLILALSVGSLALAACNTTAGVGRDIESVGGAIEGTAEDTEQEMQN